MTCWQMFCTGLAVAATVGVACWLITDLVARGVDSCGWFGPDDEEEDGDDEGC